MKVLSFHEDLFYVDTKCTENRNETRSKLQFHAKTLLAEVKLTQT